MSSEDFIVELFCRVDGLMRDQPQHPQACLHPSETVTPALLFAIKGVGERAFYTNPDQVDGVPLARGKDIFGVLVIPTRQTHTRWVYRWIDRGWWHLFPDCPNAHGCFAYPPLTTTGPIDS